MVEDVHEIVDAAVEVLDELADQMLIGGERGVLLDASALDQESRRDIRFDRKIAEVMQYFFAGMSRSLFADANQFQDMVVYAHHLQRFPIQGVEEVLPSKSGPSWLSIEVKSALMSRAGGWEGRAAPRESLLLLESGGGRSLGLLSIELMKTLSAPTIAKLPEGRIP